ncbi:hypothetical protein [Streptomyces justiciae]|uniref:hypothetical protein n=1 Tax=Streptomyces justiciae TaxID=2780140 RepID=UPI0018829603|nr:hypothetical protein [Streptomyces justiciae]MBE8477036.1 hypothetical protein [Streptomyces justiciae]
MKRAAPAALSLISVLSLAALTACGGAEQGSDAKTTDQAKATASSSASASASATKPAADPAKELAKLLVTKVKSDDNDYSVHEPASGDAMATSQKQLTLDKKVCAPMAYATNYLPLGDPEASLVRIADNGRTVYTYITLASYSAGKAEAAMKGLAEAASACTSGYTAKSAKASTTYSSVKKEAAPAATGADESIATVSTVPYKGTQTMRTQTFRFGDTIVNYFSIDSGGFINGRSSEATVPADVVKAQNAKLG